MLGLHIWGSPWVPRYSSWKTGFNKSPEEMSIHWRETLGATSASGAATGGSSIDVLITHTPAHGILDRSPGGSHAGCPALREVLSQCRPKYHICGHVHADHGVAFPPSPSGIPYPCDGTVSINASSVSDYYWIGKRRPIIIDIPMKGKVY